ncbi:GRAM domain-containing protein [Toxoplasma gondii MAS]|uniref:GRAM domain-containing protein n=1 Tax=Toxoplasma gondii MAS TaxID=943118 RepID=A0A086QZB1_TOXGO|nr:GRAM domain-containing protein [Toxoplasma gondii MAS]
MASSVTSVPPSSASSSSPSAPCSPCSSPLRSGAQSSSTICVESEKPLDPLLQLLEEQRGATKALERFCQDVVAAENDLMHALSKAKGFAADSCAPACLSPADARKHLQELLLLHGSQKQGGFAACSLSPPSPSSSPSLAASWTHTWEGSATAREEDGEAHPEGGKEEQERGQAVAAVVSPDSVASDVKPENADPTDGRGQDSPQGERKNSPSPTHAPSSLTSRPELTPSAESLPKRPHLELSAGSSPSTAPASAALPPSPSVSALESPFLGFSSSPSPSVLSCSPVSFGASPATLGPVASPLRACLAGPASASEAVSSLQETYGPCEEVVSLVGRSLFFFVCEHLQHHAELRASFAALAKAAAHQQTFVHSEKSRLDQLLPKLTSSFRLARERKTRAFSRYEKAVTEAEAAVVSRERLKTQNLNSVCSSGAASASGAPPFWALSASQTPAAGAPCGTGQAPGRGGGAGAPPGIEALGSSLLAAPRPDAGKSQREKSGPGAVSLLLPQLQRQNQRADQLFQVYVQSRREYGAASVAAAKAATSLQAVVAHLWAEEQEFLEREFLRKQKATLVGVFRTLARFVDCEEKAERALESGLAEAQKALLPAVTRCLVGDSDATRFASRVFVIGDARQQEGEREEGRGPEGPACEREARIAEHSHGGGWEGREGRDVDNAAREVEKKGEWHAGKFEGKNTSACGEEGTGEVAVDEAPACGTPRREQEEETRGTETRKKTGDSDGARPETERCRSDERTAGAELSSVLADARDLCGRLRASNRRLQSMRSLVRLLIQSLCTYQKALLAAASSLGSFSAPVSAGPDASLAASVSTGPGVSAGVGPSRGAEPLLMAGCCWQLLQACVGEVSEVCDTLRTCAGEYLLRLLDESVSQQQSTIRKLASAEGDMLRLLTASRAAKLETLNKLAKVKAVPGSAAPPEEAGRHSRRRMDSESPPCSFAVSRASPAAPEAPSSSNTVSPFAACGNAAGGEVVLGGEGGVAVHAPQSEALSAASADASSSLELLQALSERSADQEVIAAGRVKKLMKTVVAGEAQRSSLLLLQAKAVHQASIEAVSVAAAECRAASQLAERAHERQAFVRWLAEVFPVAERSVLRGLEGRRNSNRRAARRAERRSSASREEEDGKAKASGVCRLRSPRELRGDCKRAQLPNTALDASLDGERTTDRDTGTLERNKQAVASEAETREEEAVEETLAETVGARREGEETPAAESLDSKGKSALNSYASLSLQTAPSTTSLAEQRPAASEVPLSPAEVAGRKELRADGLYSEKQETERQENEQAPASPASPGASSFGTEQPSVELVSSSSLYLSSGPSSPGRVRREVRPGACRRGSRSLSEESFAFSPPSSLPESPASSLRRVRTRGEFPGSFPGDEKKKQRHKERERETRRPNELERPPTVLVAAAERMKRVEQAALWWREVVRLSSPPSPVSSLSPAVSGSAGSSERGRLISCVKGKEVCEREGAGKCEKMKTAEEYEKELPVSAVMALEEGTVKLKCAAVCDFDGSEFDALTASSFSSVVRRDEGSSRFFFRRGDILRVTVPVGSLWEGLDPRGVAGVFPASCVFVPADSVWATRPAMQDKERGSLERLVLDFFSASRSSSSSSASPLFHPASAGIQDSSPRRTSKEDDPDDGEGLAVSASERQAAALPGSSDTPRPCGSTKSEEPACEPAEEAVEPRRLPSTRVAPLCFAPTRRIQPHRKRREIRNESDSGRDMSPPDSQRAEGQGENPENGEEGETKAHGEGEEAREELETQEEMESERKTEEDGEDAGEDGQVRMHFRKGYSEGDATYIEQEKRLRATPLPGLASGEEGEDRELTGPGGSRQISRAESAVSFWYREGVDGRPTGDSTAAAAAAVAASLSSYDRLQQEEFRQRFGIAEFVLQSYSCALSRRILLQGRLYVTQNTLAFFSFFNETTIFGLETVLVIKMQDIVAVRKKVNAFFFDNSIEIELTDDRRHFFATFINRDKAFDFILALWEIHKRMVEHGSRRMLDSPLYEEERPEENASEQSPASEKQSQQSRRRRFVAVKADAAAPFPSDSAAADRLILEVKEALEKRAKRERGAEDESCQVRENQCNGVSDQEEAGAPEEKADCPSSHLRTVVPGEKYNVTLGDALHVLFVDLDNPHNPLYRAMEAQEASMKPPFPVWEPMLPISSRFASRGSCTEKRQSAERTEDLTKEGAQATEENEDAETETEEKTFMELTKRRPQRQLTYEMSLPVTTLNRLLGLPSRAELEERYTAFVLSDASVVIQKDAFVRGLPLSDCFFTRVRYRLTALNAAACASFSFERLREKLRRDGEEDQLEAEEEENEGKRGEECDGDTNEEQGGTEMPETQLDFEYEVVFVKSTFLQGKISSQGEAQVVEALAQFLQYSREALQAAVATDEERPDTGNTVDGKTPPESTRVCRPPVESSNALFACTTTAQVQTHRRLRALASWAAGSVFSVISSLFSRAKDARPAIWNTLLSFLLGVCSLSAVLGFARKLLPSTPFEGFLLVLVCMLYWRIVALETCLDEGL